MAQQIKITQTSNADMNIGVPKNLTAVEWLFIQLYENFEMKGDGREMDVILEQAKAMEKEQHGNTWDNAIDAHEKRGHVIARSLVDFDDYYNETYNK
jgi:hypothetical protein